MINFNSDNFLTNHNSENESRFDKLHSQNLIAYDNVFKTFLFGDIIELKDPLMLILFEYIEGSATSRNTTNNIAKLLETYCLNCDCYELAREIIFQYRRAQGQILATKLNIKYFLYFGTVIDDSRQFCKERAGKIFSKDEIESWSNLEWEGKIENTNPENIFFRCGGKGCRHDLMPVSERKALEIGFNIYN